MWSRRRAADRRRGLRSLGASVEPLEGRALLSAVAVRTLDAAAAAAHPRAAASLSDRQAREDLVTARHARIAEATAARLAVRAGGASKPTVAQGGAFVLNTAVNGYKLTHSLDVAKVGLNYAKLTVSHDSRKLAAAYIAAGLKGNTKTINQLNHTNLVKHLGDQFVYLSHSKPVRELGDKFSSFGRSVAKQFNHLFRIK
jgi:hypothetical protein